jgi:uncharacterized protein (DUF3820 family)
MLMTFGKYKGSPLHTINTKYLEWILPQITNPHLKQAVINEIANQIITRAGKVKQHGIKLDRQ